MKKKGFTLLEVIAVISLIVIISSVAIPAYTKITNRQRVKVDVTTATELAQMAKAYYVDYKNIVKFSDMDVEKYIKETYGDEMPRSKVNDEEFKVVLKQGGKVDVSAGNLKYIKDDKLDNGYLDGTIDPYKDESIGIITNGGV